MEQIGKRNDSKLVKVTNKTVYSQSSNEVNNTTRTVRLNDIVTLNMIFAPDDEEEIIVKLIDGIPNVANDGIKKITFNSPLGEAIKGKSVNDRASYKTDEGVINVEIKAINDSLELEKESVKVKKLEYKNN